MIERWPPSGRIEGLNAWRAILMAVGVLLHASLWLPRQPVFVAIDLCSQSFRMGCFFVISGMLSGFSLANRSVGAWLNRRLQQIGPPTLFGLAIISPTVTLLIGMLPAGAVRFQPVWIDWYHCWFLVALLAYGVSAAAAELVERRWNWVAAVDRRAAASGGAIQLPVLLWLAVAVFALMAGTSALLPALVPPTHLHAAGQLRFILGYLPVYGFGYLLARAPAFARRMLAGWLSPALILALVVVFYLRQFWAIPMLGGDTSPGSDFMVRSGGAALSPVAAAILIVRSALRIRRVPVVLDRLCDASFSIYLVHLPLIAVLTIVTAPFGWHPYASFAAIATGSATLGYLVHVLLVRRVPIVSLLLNGRRPAVLASRPSLPGQLAVA